MRYLLVDPSRALDVRLFCTPIERESAADSGESAGTRKRKSERAKERARERSGDVSFLLMRDLAKHTRYAYVRACACVHAALPPAPDGHE